MNKDRLIIVAVLALCALLTFVLNHFFRFIV